MKPNQQILSTVLTAFEYDKDPNTKYYTDKISQQIKLINSTIISEMLTDDDFRFLFALGMGVEFKIDPYSEKLYDQVEMWTRDERFRRSLVRNLDYIICSKVHKRHNNFFVSFKMWQLKWKLDKYSCLEDVLNLICGILAIVLLFAFIFLVLSLIVEYILKPIFGLIL
jgi:hypothetical protein